MRIRNVKNKYEIMRESSYFLEDPKSYYGRIQEVFPKIQPLYIEIGMGKGKFLLENAKRHPSINFIGIEKQDSVVALALKKIEEENLENLRVICLNALSIDEVFLHDVDRVYLNFSDPWPKVRHHSRRLTSKIFLEKYDSIFRNDAHIYLRTDSEELFAYSIETLSQWGYSFSKVSLNLHQEQGLITTEYEDRFSSKGIPIKAFIARRNSK